MRRLENKTLLGLIGLASLAFAWILWPFFGAVFWAAVIAIVFQSLHRRLLLSLPQRPNLAAFATTLSEENRLAANAGLGSLHRMSTPRIFRYFKTSPEIIRLAVMMYVRYPLSLRNLEHLLHE